MSLLMSSIHLFTVLSDMEILLSFLAASFPNNICHLREARFDKVLSNVVCFFALRNQVSSSIRRHQHRLLHGCCYFVQLRESTF